MCQRPASLGPLVRLAGGDLAGQVHPVQPGKAARHRHCHLGVAVVACHYAAVLGALLPQQTRQPAGVDIGDGDHFTLLQKCTEIGIRAPVAQAPWQVAYYQTGCEDAVRFHVFRVDPGVTDVRIGQGDDLARIGRIAEYLLITGHCCIEDDLADGLARYSD
jgi:hypothetical protein